MLTLTPRQYICPQNFSGLHWWYLWPWSKPNRFLSKKGKLLISQAKRSADGTACPGYLAQTAGRRWLEPHSPTVDTDINAITAITITCDIYKFFHFCTAYYFNAVTINCDIYKLIQFCTDCCFNNFPSPPPKTNIRVPDCATININLFTDHCPCGIFATWMNRLGSATRRYFERWRCDEWRVTGDGGCEQ